MTTLDERLRGTLNAVAQTTDVAWPLMFDAEPTATRRTTARRRTMLVASCVLVGTFTSSLILGAAQAAGTLPRSVSQLLPGGAQRVDMRINPAEAHQVLVYSGPDSTRFVVWVADWKRGGRCVAATFQFPSRLGALAPPTKSDFQPIGCGPDRFKGFRSFAVGGAGARYIVFAYDISNAVSAGAVSRVELRLGDGSSRNVAVVNGWVAGWTPTVATEDAAGVRSAILTGYGPSGEVNFSVDVVPEPCTGGVKPCNPGPVG